MPNTPSEHDLLEQLLKERCERAPLSFRDFMASALYHPTLGYYSSTPKIGRDGDFMTAVRAGCLFGQLLAQCLHDLWCSMGSPSDCALIESGAHDGTLARDILRWTRDFSPEFHRAICYQIIEPLSLCRTAQQTALSDFAEKMEWVTGPSPTPCAHGIHIANEVLDALPCHLLRFENGRYQEVCVTCADGHLDYCTLQITDTALLDWLQSECPPEIEGYTCECCTDLEPWIRDTLSGISCGYALWIDYGLHSPDLLHPSRPQGTLRGYRQHTLCHDLLSEPGRKDLTYHVNWSRVKQATQAVGWRTVGFTDQHHFFTDLVKEDLVAAEATGAAQRPEWAAWMRAFQTLTHPGQMGTQFQVYCASALQNAPLPKGFRTNSCKAKIRIAESHLPIHCQSHDKPPSS